MIRKVAVLILIASPAFADNFTSTGTKVVAGYHLDENAGSTTVDVSSNGAYLTITGATWVSAPNGSGLKFVTDKAQSQSSPAFRGLTDWTIQFSLRVDNMIGDGGCNGHGAANNCGAVSSVYNGVKVGHILGVTDLGTLFIDAYTNGSAADIHFTSVTNQITQNVWTHVVMTGFSNTTINFYLNGKIMGTSTGTFSVATTNLGLRDTDNILTIGALYNNGSNQIKATIDEYVMYNRKWTSADVTQDYARWKGLHSEENDQ